jgi:Family of unknown function (DUF6325)
VSLDLPRLDGMSVGSIQLIAVKFPGRRFTTDIVTVLNNLVDSGTIRIVDLLLATKDHLGTMHILELDDLDAESLAALEPLVEDGLGLFDDGDVCRLGARLERGWTAGILVCETVCTTRFSEAVAA